MSSRFGRPWTPPQEPPPATPSVVESSPADMVRAMTAYFDDVAPVFPVGDLTAALGHYRTLGFTVRAQNDEYGYAVRGGVTVHLALVSGMDTLRSNSVAYLLVDDAQSLYDEWQEAAPGGQLQMPKETPYGASEGSYRDPDGNVLRFGSPIDD